MSNTGSSRVTIGRIGSTPQITDPWSSGLEKKRPSRCGGPKSLGEPTYRKIGRRKILQMRVHDPGTTATQSATETAAAKLNRIYLCTFNRMAQSCIYFVLFLVILSPNTSCALRSSAGETQNYTRILSNDSASTIYNVSSLHSSSRTNSSSAANDDANVDYHNELHKADSGLEGDRAGRAQAISGGKYDYNYKNTHTNARAKDEIVDSLQQQQQSNSLDFDGVDMFGAFSIPEEAIYTNEFAVNIPAGKQVADVIASKHGFINKGQIGSLDNYYLFQHHHVSKRSLRSSLKHQGALKSENEVKWMQQQHEKVRRKRDGPYQDLPTYKSISLASHSQRMEYRDVSSHFIFPDPLFKEQWYLVSKNGGAKDGLDMNVGPAWQKGYTGKGVVVSILDDGIQTNHPDLAQNYDPEASFDINGNDSDPTPQDNGDNKHGTRCAGEVAAVAFNNYCGVGVAYNASIGGVRMLDGKVNDVVEAQALSLNPSHIDIYSASWGPEDDGSTVDGPGPLARRAFIYGVTSGRQGKGSIFVWASGNGGRYTDSCNCDGYTNSIFTLSISSATQAGFKPWYLEECSSTLATTYSSGTPGHDKSVATVDMDGSLRPDHICTVEHTGTSASAPLAAGICALALEANPELTWRDMQYLVVYTSRSAPLEKEGGWTLNGVKRKYSHKFGYGLMDAGAMVSLAEQWTSVPPQHICKSRENNEDRKIDGVYGYTLSTHMDVNGCAGTINEVRYLEHVQCRITLRFFPRGNLRILLTSPMGTTSTLLLERPRDIVKSNFDDWPFLSVHFWGEKAEGRWTLQVINDGRRRVNQPGILSKWQLIFYGTSTQPMRLKSELLNSSPQLRSPSSSNPFLFPSASNTDQLGNEGGSFNTDRFASYLNYQNIFSSAGSDPEPATATLDGQNVNASMASGLPAESLGFTASAAQLVAAPESRDGDKKILHSCDAECDSSGCYGRGPTQCVACSHYRLDNTCVSRCPPRSFPNQVGICWPCHDTCETCAGAGPDSCLTCAPAHLHVIDLAVCLQFCPDGYFENSRNRTCVPCEPNCASCQDHPEYCTSCDHHLVMHEHKCYSACPLDTYETEDNKCAFCHSTCATCNGPTDQDCITCRSSRYAWQNKCLISCPDGFYADKKRLECMPCQEGCKTCTSNGVCSECLQNWTLNKRDKCIVSGSEGCSESEFFSLSEGKCRPCHESCGSCNGPADTNCMSCPPIRLLEQSRCVSGCREGFFMEAGSLCSPCLHTCSQCVSRTNCSNCSKGLELQNGECRTTCADGYYSDRGICAKCYLSCHTCSGPRRNQCVQCPAGWQMAAGECHPECPEGFYKSDFGCQKCHHYCKSCNDAGPLACTSCPPHSMLDGGLCMECLSSQYYDTTSATCKTCHDSCRSCFGPGQFSCKACVPPLHLDQLNGQCVSCCQNQTQAENTSSAACCHCDGDTGECKATSTGGKRRTVVGSGSAYKSSESKHGSFESDGNARDFVLRLDSPLTAITAIAVAICLLIITIFSIIFAVLQRNSNHVSRNSVRYRKIANTSSGRRKNLSTKPTSDARFIFNIGEDEDTDGDNSDDEMDANVGTDINRIVYDRKGNDHGHEFYIESTNDIDAIEFHCKVAQTAETQPRRCNTNGDDTIPHYDRNTNVDRNPSTTSRTNIRS